MMTRSRIRWAEHGEKSSRYFCNLEKRNSEKKIIRQLKLEGGHIVNDHSTVLNEIHRYYSNLYTADSEISNEQTASFFAKVKSCIPSFPDN